MPELRILRRVAEYREQLSLLRSARQMTSDPEDRDTHNISAIDGATRRLIADGGRKSRAHFGMLAQLSDIPMGRRRSETDLEKTMQI